MDTEQEHTHSHALVIGLVLISLLLVAALTAVVAIVATQNGYREDLDQQNTCATQYEAGSYGYYMCLEDN